jgi:hypothetical protein
MPIRSSSAAARSLARRRHVGVRGDGPVGASNLGVSASAKRWSASREVIQRLPRRSASSRTTSPAGLRTPSRIHLKTVES